nr:MAG TPA: PaaA2 [Caudoviricetes sp.]
MMSDYKSRADEVLLSRGAHNHEAWLKEQVAEAMDKAERGEAVYYSAEDAEEIMNNRKAEIAAKNEAKE